MPFDIVCIEHFDRTCIVRSRNAQGDMGRDTTQALYQLSYPTVASSDLKPFDFA